METTGQMIKRMAERMKQNMELNKWFMEFCPNCDQMEPHARVENDLLFEHAIECMHCHIIWEAESEVESK